MSGSTAYSDMGETLGHGISHITLRTLLNRQLDRNACWIPLVLAICSTQLLLIWTHEPWLDEWQALQIALQSPTFAALLESLRYEGHPPLWYLMLRGAGAVLPPAFVLPAVQTPIALGIQALIQFKAPFQRLERLLIGISFFVLFDYGTLSRGLSFGILLLICAFAFRKNFVGWMAIALLPLADFLFGVLSLACIILRNADRDFRPSGFLLWLLCGTASAISVIPAADMIPAFWLNGPLFEAYIFLTRLSVLLIPLHGPQFGLEWNQPLPDGLSLAGGVLFLWMGDILTRDIVLHRIIYLGFATVLLLFSLCVYPLAIRHLSLLAFLIILLRWRAYERSDSPASTRLFRGWLSVAAACGVLTAGISMVRPFDTASQAADYIRKQGLQDKHWLSFPDSRAQGVSAITGMEFTRLERNCTQSFVRWNYRSTIKSQADFDKVLHHITARYGHVYLLSDFRITPEGNPRFYKLLKYIPAGYNGQPFYLWSIGSDLPESAMRPPQCAPIRKPLAIYPGLTH